MNIFFFILVLFLASCSKNDLDTPSYNSTEKREISVYVQYGDDDDSKTRMSVEVDDDVWDIRWEKDDAVGGWSADGSITKFTMADIGSDYNSATFTGEGTNGYMYLIYPYDASITNATSYPLDLSTQDVDMSDPYMAYGDNNLYMFSSKFAVSDTDANYSPKMYHILGGMELEIVPYNVDGESFSITGAEIIGCYNSANVNFSDKALQNTTSGSINLNISNAPELEEGVLQLIPFSIIPFTTSDNITIILTTSDGDKISITKYLPGSSIEFKAGYHSTLVTRVDVGNKCAVEFDINSFSSSSLPETDVWYFYNTAFSTTAFSTLKSALQKANSEGREIEVLLPNLTSAIPDNAFQDCYALKSIYMPYVTEIGSYAFEGCTNLTSVTMESVTNIGAYAFMYCTNITSIYLPKALYIELSTFAYCSSLSQIDVPILQYFAFNLLKNCTSLESIVIGKAKTIYSSVFEGCTALTSITLSSTQQLDVGSYSGISTTAFEGLKTEQVTLYSYRYRRLDHPTK
ncbi:MAG: leucine-rich repeat domain-containing protein [Rikenellaceae bacterium]